MVVFIVRLRDLHALLNETLFHDILVERKRANMISRCVIGKDPSCTQQVHNERLVSSISSSQRTFSEQWHQGHERTHVHHLNSEILVKSRFGEQSYQLSDIAYQV